MRIQQFLEHHGIQRNPFAEEDAQTDPIFKEFCIASVYHPTWDKVYGDPLDPSTSVVFGEKGSGKTAMRLQVAAHLDQFNREHSGQQTFVIEYDDFNPFLDRFCDRVAGRIGPRRRRPDRALAEWKLWDHMDSILALGVTGLVDRVLEVRQPSTSVHGECDPSAIAKLDRHQARDLLLLAAFYDQSLAETFKGRWHRLRRKLKFRTWTAHGTLALGIVWTLAWVVILALLLVQDPSRLQPLWLYLPVPLLGWLPWLWRTFRLRMLARSVVKRMRTGNRDTGQLRQVLSEFTRSELAGQPLPNKVRTDDRYELLLKFQALLKTLGFSGIIVLVDRVDEPHVINGSAELMKAFLWPMLDNKFLKHPGLGLKLMLPLELTRFIEREDRDFYQRARLDKQNMVSAFQWSGQALYDVANTRLLACASPGSQPKLRDLFDSSITDQRLLETMRSLRVPRRLFKFLYAVLVAHCNAHTEEHPAWKVSAETFESTLALQLRDQDSFDRGMGAG